MDKKLKYFVTGVLITLFISLLFGYIVYQNNIFIPHLTTFNVVIIAAAGAFFYWGMAIYNLKTGLLTLLSLLILMLLIFSRNMSISFIILEVLVFLSIGAALYVNYKIFEPRIKTIFLPFTLPVLLIVFSSIAFLINYFRIILSGVKTFDSSIIFKTIVIEIVQNEIVGLGLGIGIFLANIIIKNLDSRTADN